VRSQPPQKRPQVEIVRDVRRRFLEAFRLMLHRLLEHGTLAAESKGDGASGQANGRCDVSRSRTESAHQEHWARSPQDVLIR
jgi:hypothetical protein